MGLKHVCNLHGNQRINKEKGIRKLGVQSFRYNCLDDVATEISAKAGEFQLSSHLMCWESQVYHCKNVQSCRTIVHLKVRFRNQGG